MLLRHVQNLLQKEFRSAEDLRRTVQTGLKRLRVPAPLEIAFWQFLSGGKLACGVHIELEIEGTRYRFERDRSGLRTIDLSPPSLLEETAA